MNGGSVNGGGVNTGVAIGVHAGGECGYGAIAGVDGRLATPSCCRCEYGGGMITVLTGDPATSAGFRCEYCGVVKTASDGRLIHPLLLQVAAGCGASLALTHAGEVRGSAV